MSAQADELTTDKQKDIEKLLEMTNATALAKQLAMNLSENVKAGLTANRPDIPSEVLNELPSIINEVFDENTELLRSMYIPLYNKHFTANEIKEMIVFYSSPLGQKTIRIMPALFQDGLRLGQVWSASIEPQVERRIKEMLSKKGIQI